MAQELFAIFAPLVITGGILAVALTVLTAIMEAKDAE